MVSDLVERNRTEEPDAGVPHVRICGEGAGQPVPLPGGITSLRYVGVIQIGADQIRVIPIRYPHLASFSGMSLEHKIPSHGQISDPLRTHKFCK